MELVYVRFGDVPECGRSWNSLDKFYEEGVSVYEAIHRDGVYQILLPKMDSTSIISLGMCFNAAQGLSGQIDRKNCLYLVEGNKIGIGSDGEPLLKSCKIIREIFHKEINDWRLLNE